MPQWLVIENLEIRGARTPNTFTGPARRRPRPTRNPPRRSTSSSARTSRSATATCTTTATASSRSPPTRSRRRNILRRGQPHPRQRQRRQQLRAQRVRGGDRRHVQYNRFGRLLPGAGGNNLKDRSAGLVVRYNWIEGSNRQLDLVRRRGQLAGPRRPALPRDPRLRQRDHRASQQRQQRHRATTAATAARRRTYRKGTLYFYNNTVVSDRTDTTRLFRMATNDESIDARNNIAYVTAAGGNLQVLDNYGRLTLTQNWFKTGWTPFHGAVPRGRSSTTAPSPASTPGS